MFTSDILFTEFDGLIVSGMMRGLGEQRFDVATIVNLERDKAEGETFTQFFMRKGIRGAIVRTDTHYGNEARERDDDHGDPPHPVGHQIWQHPP